MKIKRIISLICTMMVIITSIMISPVTSSALTREGNSGNITWKINEKNGLLSISKKQSIKSSTVAMPDYTSETLPPWYKYADKIKTATISDGITNIGSYSFFELKNLTKVNIPKSVQSVNRACFMRCDSLKEFTVASSSPYLTVYDNILFNKSKTKLICFPACKVVDNNTYTIPNGVKYIQGFAFNSNKTLVEITVPSSVSTIYACAFTKMEKLKKIHLNNGVKTLSYKVFYNNDKLKTVVIPPSVTKIGADLFNKNTENLIIYGANNSTVQSYAKNNGYTFSEKKYVFNLNVKTFDNETKKVVNFGYAIGTLPETNKAGHKFEGWYLGDSKVTENTIYTIASDSTIIARYSGLNYTLTLNPCGGKCDTTTKEIIFGSTYGELPIPVRSGYSFIGWSDSKTNFNKIHPEDIYDNENITILYAFWEKNLEKTKDLKIKYINKTKVKLTWQKQNNVKGYEIFRKVNNGNYKLYKTVSKNTVKLSLEKKKTYKFKVRAYIISAENQKKYGAFSNSVKRSKTYVEKPKVKIYSYKKHNIVQLKWNKISNAKRYEIYMHKNGKYRKVKTISSPACAVQIIKGKSYRFKIRAYTTVLGHKIHSKFTYVKFKG